MVLTLCRSCADAHRDMEDRTIKRKDQNQTIKEPCDICTRMGYDYVIEIINIESNK